MTSKIIILSIAFVASCHDDNPGATCAPGTTLMDNQCVPDSTCGSGTMLMNGMCVPTSSTPTYVQVEHLARPGINEALVLSNANLEGYNATAPSFAGAPPDAVAAITAEAKAVLKALYLGGCLLDGVLGLTADSGVHPAGATCNAVGGALFAENNPLTGVTLTQATKDASQAYADRVFDQFEPDVMRIDTSLPVSGYLNLCGDPTTHAPLLCGGRFLTDDVIDVTYNYLLAGAAITTSSPAQFRALVGDGVNYSVATPGAGTVSIADGTNGAQGHPAVTQGFPYSAPPF